MIILKKLKKEWQETNFIIKYLLFLFFIISLFFLQSPEPFTQSIDTGLVSPYFDLDYLQKGEYEFQIQYNNPYTNNEVVLFTNTLTSTQNQRGVELERQILDIGEGVIEFTLSLESDVEHIRIETTNSVPVMEAVEIQSTGLLCFDHYFLAISFLFLAIFVFLYSKWFYKTEHNEILLLIVVGCIVSFPIMNDKIAVAHDTIFHLSRLNGIYEGLEAGQFPVRMDPTQLKGFGYISGIMYPQLFLYLPALLKFLNLSTMLVYKLMILGINIATPLVTYYSMKRIFGSSKIGLFTGIIYTLSISRLVNLYSRDALGEVLAMIFLPLVLWGVYEILWNNYKKWYVLMIGMSLLAQAHLISVALSALIIIIEIIVLLFSKKKNHLGQRFLSMAKATIGTIGLNMFFLGPFLYYSMEDFRCFHHDNLLKYSTIDVLYVFDAFPRAYGDVLPSLGLLPLLGGGLFLLAVYKKNNHTTWMNIGKHCLLIGTTCLLLVLWIAPWDTWQSNALMNSFIVSIQMAGRLISPASIMFSVVMAIGIITCRESFPKWNWLLPVLGILVFMSPAYFFSQMRQASDVVYLDKMQTNGLAEADMLYLYDDIVNMNYYSPYESYIKSNAPDQVTYDNYIKSGTDISADIKVNMADIDLYFPLYFYSGYEITLDGESINIFRHDSLVACQIPVGTYHLEVHFVGIPFFTVCDIISVLFLAGFLIYAVNICWRKRHFNKNSIQIPDEL